LLRVASNLYALEIDPTPERDIDAAGESEQESFLTELASSIPGIDEAMVRLCA
jgi:arsenite-transporting ATPase